MSVFPNSKGKGSYGAMEIFEKIEKLLDAKGLRFADLGRATGMSSARMTQLRQGVGKVSTHELLSSARFLGVTVDYLIDPPVSEPQPKPSPSEEAVLEMIRTLGIAEAKRRLLLAGPAFVVEPQSREGSAGTRK